MSKSALESPSVVSEASPNGEPSFAEILSQFEDSHRQEPEAETGSVQGAVVAVTDDYVVVDIGRKMEGVIPAHLLRDESGACKVRVGDNALVSINGRAEGYYLLSVVEVRRPTDWSGLERAFAEKAAIAGMVTGAVKGGFSVDVGVRAFLPASRSGARDEAEMQSLVGQEIKCRIIKLDTAEEDVVVDRRVILEEEQQKRREEAFAALEEGTVMKGRVRSLMDYGAFVDLGGFDGLLHVADMAWGRIGKPSEIFSEGEEIEVKVLKIERETRRISLGLKQLTPDPWSLADQNYQMGQKVRGKVVRLADFGAFVELEPGLEGLVHVSELSWSKKIRKPSDVLKTGDVVEVMVMGVNPAERRLSLGLKQVIGDPWDDVATKYPVGTVVEAPVTSLAKFGAFLELAEGLEGMIHIGDISAERRLNHPQEILKVGETVKAVVLEIDRSRRRLRLGMKQLVPTPLDEFIAGHRPGDKVSGRVLESGPDFAKVELGEGIIGYCRFAKLEKETAKAAPAPADLSTLTAMLAAKWKQGSAPQAAAGNSPVRGGEIRSFLIKSLDPSSKRIELDLPS